MRYYPYQFFYFCITKRRTAVTFANANLYGVAALTGVLCASGG